MSNHANVKTVRRAALIGGSGFSGTLDAELSVDSTLTTILTEFGDVDVRIWPIGEEAQVVFIARHGARHATAPHLINHHAHMSALNQMGVTHILGTSAVGSLRREIGSGALVVLDDFVDLRGGATTFFNLPGRVTHTDFSAPFSDTLRMMVLEEAANVSTEWLDPPIVYPAGSYLCLNGPRYETPAEIRLFASWGLDVVGMTVAPEAILAHELDIEYCNISVVTNLGTGLASATLAHSEVEAQMAHSRPFVLKVLIRTLKRVLEGPA